MDREVIEKAKNGDIKAFEAIYATYAGFVFNVVFGIVQNRDSAEDVTQQLFIRLYDKLRSFRYGARLKTYIYRMAVNMAINEYKRLRRQRKRLVSMEEVGELHQLADRDAIQDGRDKELAYQLLSRLSPEHRTVIVLREMEGLSYEDIASTLNININTVRSRLSRARQVLMAAFREIKDAR